MKEHIVKIPEAEVETISNMLEKYGLELNPVQKKVEKKRIVIKKKPLGKGRKGKIDHTYLFGKWKDFDIDPKKLREQSW